MSCIVVFLFRKGDTVFKFQREMAKESMSMTYILGEYLKNVVSLLWPAEADIGLNLFKNGPPKYLEGVSCP
jgi:hypothetical protein